MSLTACYLLTTHHAMVDKNKVSIEGLGDSTKVTIKLEKENAPEIPDDRGESQESLVRGAVKKPWKVLYDVQATFKYPRK